MSLMLIVICIGTVVDVDSTNTSSTQEHLCGSITGLELQDDVTNETTTFNPLIPETRPVFIDLLNQYVSDNHSNLNSGFKEQFKV